MHFQLQFVPLLILRLPGQCKSPPLPAFLEGIKGGLGVLCAALALAVFMAVSLMLVWQLLLLLLAP